MSSAKSAKEDLSQRVQAYTRWKHEVIQDGTRYRRWLNAYGLNSIELDGRLSQALHTVKNDRILLAFVGEFSRGKSEMINALLSRHYKQRLLPTRIGRTTMCPTELYYDGSVTSAYIKLLPIQTRKEAMSLSEYKQQLEHWVHLSINLDDASAMRKAFQEVAKTIAVSREEAADLGFQVEYLEVGQESGKVQIPAWRHALINIDHPLLRQGLSIIDTPGLNALGSEPELTLSLLPDAHAVLFVLSADTGLTATDHMIWNEHVREIVQRHGAALYGVLNKIDMLWDEDEDAADIEAHVTRQVRLTAQQLQIPMQHVLPLSARTAVKAHLMNDVELLQRNHLAELEQVLAQSVIAHKQQILQQSVVLELVQMVESSVQALSDRRQQLHDERELLAQPDHQRDYELVALTRTVQGEQQAYNRRLAVLQSARKLMETQLPKLRQVVTAEQLAEHLTAARQQAQSGVLGSGLAQAVGQFFAALRSDLMRLREDAVSMDGMVFKLYQRYAQEAQEDLLDYPRLGLDALLLELQQMEVQSAPYRSRISNMIGAQKAADRFFASIAHAAGQLYLKAAQQSEQWCKSSLGPLMQQTMQYRARVQQMMEQLTRMKAQSADSEKMMAVDARIAELARQSEELASIRRSLKP